MIDFLLKKQDRLEFICKDLKVKNLYAFGSVLSDNFKQESDLDLLVSFSSDLSIKTYTNNYFKMYYQLKHLYKREIDLITDKSLKNPFFADQIDKTKKLLYASRN